MRYGIYLPNFGPYGDAHTLAALARDAEASGWDGFFLWDHIAGWQLDIVDPWVALTAVALNTHRIRIGTTVTPLPRRRPWKVARETVSLDRLSGGRLILSVGIGLGQGEWDDLGEVTDLKTRGAMLDEALDVLVGLWSGEPFSYNGTHYHLNNVRFTPVALQKPRIPIWVGGFWPNAAPFKRAARWDGAFPLFNPEAPESELDQLEKAVALLQTERKSNAPFDIVCTGITPGENRSRAAAITHSYAERGATWWLECIAPFRFDKGFDEPWPVDELRERILQGPPG